MNTQGKLLLMHKENSLCPGRGSGTDLAEKSAWDGLQWGPSSRQGIFQKTEDEEEGWRQPAQSFLFFSTPAQVFPHLTEDSELRSSAEEEESPQPSPGAGRNQGRTLVIPTVPICVSAASKSALGGIFSAAVTRDRNRCLGLAEFSPPPPSKLYKGTEICVRLLGWWESSCSEKWV